MKYSYFEAKKREMKFIDIFSKKQNHIFEVKFKVLNNDFKGTETIEKTITNKKTLIKNINSIKEKMLKKLIIIPIIKFKENYYKTNVFFNEFEYEKKSTNL